MKGSAQLWVQPNATWHYDYWTIGWEGFVKIQHIGDSVILGKSTMVFESKDYRFFTDEFGEMTFAGPFVMDTNYTFAHGDTVFYWQNDQFQKLFDFSKGQGENYLIGQTEGDFLCVQESFTEVVGNGQDALGFGFISLFSPDTAELRLYGDFNRRFGGGEFIFPRKYICDPQIIVEYYNYTFKCFEDDGYFYNPSGEDCEYLLNTLGLDKIAFTSKLIFPNPVNSHFQISDADLIKSVSIFDTRGNCLLEYSSLNSSFDVSSLLAGIYIVKIGLINGQSSIQRLVKKE